MFMRRRSYPLLALSSVLGVGVLAAEKPEPPKPDSRTNRQIEGWTVRVDDRLLAPPHEVLGARVRHYGLTDHKEFFAEMSEAYFGMNAFFPFNRAELKREEPELFSMLLKIWGPLPSPITPKEPSAGQELKK